MFIIMLLNNKNLLPKKLTSNRGTQKPLKTNTALPIEKNIIACITALNMYTQEGLIETNLKPSIMKLFACCVVIALEMHKN